ncbi:MAG: 30S ribosome-binding factor RbfA [Solirubrobacteraceae bacterium]
MRRIDAAVRAVLSDAITKELQDPRVGFVTVTGVKTSSDLRHASVYVSVLGDERARADTLLGLQSAHGFLQGRLAGELKLKHTPTLEFEYDGSIDRGMRISELIHRELGAEPADLGGPESDGQPRSDAESGRDG